MTTTEFQQSANAKVSLDEQIEDSRNRTEGTTIAGGFSLFFSALSAYSAVASTSQSAGPAVGGAIFFAIMGGYFLTNVRQGTIEETNRLIADRDAAFENDSQQPS